MTGRTPYNEILKARESEYSSKKADLIVFGIIFGIAAIVLYNLTTEHQKLEINISEENKN